MLNFFLDWAHYLIRWVHVIAASLWLGRLLYFTSMKSNPENKAENTQWLIHGDGFYEVIKRTVAEARVPKNLPLLKYDIVITWLSGLLLITLLYYAPANSYLLAPGSGITKASGILLSSGGIITSWLLYDLLWIFIGSLSFTLAALGTGVLTFVFANFFFFYFSESAAYLHLGAMIGTWMTFNAIFRVIPIQRKMLNAAIASIPFPAESLEKARIRSFQNSYLAFPVFFLMLASHGAALHAGELNPFFALSLIGLGIALCHIVVAKKKKSKLTALVIASIILFLLFGFGIWNRKTISEKIGRAVTPETVRLIEIVNQRCTPCHANYPSIKGFAANPGGINLESEHEIFKNKERILIKAVFSDAMPPGNITQITEEERGMLKAALFR